MEPLKQDTSETGPPVVPEGPGATLRIHRELTVSSAANTLLFYGTVLLFCLLLPVFVTLGVGVFFLFFYKREIGDFVKSPLKRTRLRASPPSVDVPYRIERFEPGAFDRDP